MTLTCEATARNFPQGEKANSLTALGQADAAAASRLEEEGPPGGGGVPIVQRVPESRHGRSNDSSSCWRVNIICTNVMDSWDESIYPLMRHC